MYKKLTEIEKRIGAATLVLEVRDARVPDSSASSMVRKVLGQKKHVIVMNKQDLITSADKLKMQKKYEAEGSKVIFTNGMNTGSVRQLLPKSLIKSGVLPATSKRLLIIAVVGVPNTGKSSIINTMRVLVKMKASSKVGALAGVTRSVSTLKLSENPDSYLIDTPGIVQPALEDPEGMLRLALIGSTGAAAADPILLADYLLFVMNKLSIHKYVPICGLKEPSSDIYEVLMSLSYKIGKKTNDPDIRHLSAALRFLKLYRLGSLGKFVVDDVPDADPETIAALSLAENESENSDK